jgi:phage-related protein
LELYYNLTANRGVKCWNRLGKNVILSCRVLPHLCNHSQKKFSKEYADIVDELERNGRLSMPTGEKVDSTLFAIRVIQAGNVRVFYVYGKENNIYGLHGYVKKTQQIPAKEKRLAEKIVKLLRKEELL